MLGLILTSLQDQPLILTSLQDRPLLPIQGQDCTSKTPTMHVHEHIMTTLANQQLVVKHSPARLSQVGVQQFSQLCWQIKDNGSLTPLACILVVRQLDAQQQGRQGDDVQPVALTTRQLARPLVTGSNQASDA